MNFLNWWVGVLFISIYLSLKFAMCWNMIKKEEKENISRGVVRGKANSRLCIGSVEYKDLYLYNFRTNEQQEQYQK